MIENRVAEHVSFAHDPPQPTGQRCIETIATQLIHGDQHYELGRRGLDDGGQQADGQRESDGAAKHGRRA